MIQKAWYVTCDKCGNPAEISTESRRESRNLAIKVNEFIYYNRQDICPFCQNKQKLKND